MQILIPILTLGTLGLVFGLLLVFASKKFCVKQDERVSLISRKLPGANCGACGNPGCLQFTEKLIKGECSVDSCPVTPKETKEEIARILGKEAAPEKVKKVAVLHCSGGNKVKDKFSYSGVKDCSAANLLAGGQKECFWGCLGFGTCVRSCAFGAIKMGPDGLPEIDESKCTACGACIKVCPKNLFSLIDVNKEYYVACSSLDNGKKVMSVCKAGCIACKRCQTNCPVSAIAVVDNLARFNYDKCSNLGKCAAVCPTKVIKKRRH